MFNEIGSRTKQLYAPIVFRDRHVCFELALFGFDSRPYIYLICINMPARAMNFIELSTSMRVSKVSVLRMRKNVIRLLGASRQLIRYN